MTATVNPKARSLVQGKTVFSINVTRPVAPENSLLPRKFWPHQTMAQQSRNQKSCPKNQILIREPGASHMSLLTELRTNYWSWVYNHEKQSLLSLLPPVRVLSGLGIQAPVNRMRVAAPETGALRIIHFIEVSSQGAGMKVWLSLASRLYRRSSAVTLDCTPAGGTSALAIQSNPFKSTRRLFSSSQFLWKCPPV